MAESVDRKKARFTERPFSALSPPRPADHPSGWSLGSRPPVQGGQPACRGIFCRNGALDQRDGPAEQTAATAAF